MTYLDGKWAARNMKLAQIDYLSTTGGSNSKPSTMVVGGMGLGRGGGGECREKKQIDFLFVPPLGKSR